VLGPEEVQIKSSHRNLKTDDGLLTDIVLGDILVRIPCLNNSYMFRGAL
jgi:RNA-dependent RNA polymerase